MVLPWEVPQWDERHCDNDLAQLVDLAPQEFFPLLHALSRPLLARVPCYSAPMTELPFDTLVGAVFTRAFEKAGLPSVRTSQATAPSELAGHRPRHDARRQRGSGPSRRCGADRASDDG